MLTCSIKDVDSSGLGHRSHSAFTKQLLDDMLYTLDICLN